MIWFIRVRSDSWIISRWQISFFNSHFYFVLLLPHTRFYVLPFVGLGLFDGRYVGVVDERGVVVKTTEDIYNHMITHC